MEEKEGEKKTEEKKNTGEKNESETELLLAKKEEAVEGLQKKYNELLDGAKRLAADFDNFRKRTEQEREKEKDMATKSVILKLLPILDQFTLSLGHAGHHNEFVKAMILIDSQIISLLEEWGVRKITALHEKFNPHVHEAVMYVPSEKEDNVIVEEIQKGYTMHEAVLRTSKVKVAKKLEE